MLGQAGSEHEAVVRPLLEKGANITVKTNSRDIAFHLVARMGRIEVVRLLLEKAVDTKTKDKN